MLQAWSRVLDRAGFIGGAEISAFETAFAAHHGATHGVALSSGTDALELGLRALGVGPGDEVIVPASTFVATAFAVARVGAKPIFVDVCEGTWTMDPAAAAAAISPRTVGMIPVHLYGRIADLDALYALTQRHGLFLFQDACQAHGATANGRPLADFGVGAAFSFYPSKNLGGTGDGGAVLTQDPKFADAVRCLSNQGRAPEDRGRHVRIGTTARMDALTAAALQIALPELPRWNRARRVLATTYDQGLTGLPTIQRPQPPFDVVHLYVIHTDDRDQLQAALGEQGIATAVHYPMPCHRQPALAAVAPAPGRLPVAERAAKRALSLPLFPTMAASSVHRVCAAIQAWTQAT